jgi:hypothetical protein
MHYNEMQFTYHVMFFVSNVRIGKALHFGDRECIVTLKLRTPAIDRA